MRQPPNPNKPHIVWDGWRFIRIRAQSTQYILDKLANEWCHAMTEGRNRGERPSDVSYVREAWSQPAFEAYMQGVINQPITLTRN